MKQFSIDCWELSNIDFDGRGETHVAYISSELDALAWEQASSAWRVARPYKKVITVFDSIAEMEESATIDKKIAALKKLSNDEIKLLNIDLSGINVK